MVIATTYSNVSWKYMCVYVYVCVSERERERESVLGVTNIRFYNNI